MKKIFASAVLALVALAALAQEYSTTWPYLYQEFTNGTVYMKGGTKATYDLNVHIMHSRLHFIDNGVIKEANLAEVLLVKIGDDQYMNVDGQIMKVVKSEERGFVAALQLGDFDKLRESGGAYGTSTTNSATQKLSSIEVSGKVNQNHMELREGRHNGESVDLVTTYYLVTPDKTYKASRKGIDDELDAAGKAAFKNWLKSNKVKWNNPDSIITVLDFLCK